ncbi:hypothetical protein MTO96_029277 [Rhipicephalus appendiculatus]
MSSVSDDAGSKKFYLFAGALMFLLLCAIIYVLLSHTSSSAAAVKGDDGSGGGGDDKVSGGGSGGSFIAPTPPPPPAPKTPFHRVTTAEVFTTSPTADTAKETPDPARPPRKPRVTSINDVIMCTMSYRALYGLQMPPDGVCTHIVYSEVLIQNQQVISMYDTSGDSLSAFMDHAKQAQKTRHGASFSYQYADDAATVINSASSSLQDLWNSNIYDYGMLYAYDKASELQSSSNAKLSLLNALSTQQNALKQGSASFDTFVGVLNSDYGDDSTDAMQMLKDVSNNYPITIIIFITHFFVLDGAPSPRPPTTLTGSGRPPKVGISDNLSKAGVKPTVALLVSFTLTICKYLMASGWSGDVTGSYVSFAPIRYYDACEMRSSMVEQSHKDYAYIAISDQQVLLMYDTLDTLHDKLQEVFKTYNHPKHGLAVYDVDYDQYNTTCGTPPFNRLLQIVRYMNM